MRGAAGAGGLKRVLKEAPVLLVGTMIGVLGTAAYEFAKQERPQLTVQYTALASELPDYVHGTENETPDISLHKFSWKNSGNQNLKELEIEFAPGGGDGAYDETITQKLAVNRAMGPAFGRTGVTTTRVGNVLKIHYDRFPIDAVDNITITSPSIVADYDVTVSDPDIDVTLELTKTELEDPVFAALQSQGPGWLVYILSGAVVILSITLGLFTWKRRRP